MAVNYGVIKGGEDARSVVLTDSAGWPAAAETTWAWKLLLNRIYPLGPPAGVGMGLVSGV